MLNYSVISVHYSLYQAQIEEAACQYPDIYLFKVIIVFSQLIIWYVYVPIGTYFWNSFYINEGLH